MVPTYYYPVWGGQVGVCVVPTNVLLTCGGGQGGVCVWYLPITSLWAKASSHAVGWRGEETYLRKTTFITWGAAVVSNRL